MKKCQWCDSHGVTCFNIGSTICSEYENKHISDLHLCIDKLMEFLSNANEALCSDCDHENCNICAVQENEELKRIVCKVVKG